MNTMRHAWVILIALLSAGAAARAIPPTAAPPATELETVDPGVGDVHSLAISLRAMPPNLSQPSGFDRVYRVPGSDDLLMRANGGLYAVFPRSTYVPSPVGLVPVIGDNTVFYIGAPPVEPSRPSVDAGNRIHPIVTRRVDGRAPSSRDAVPVEQPFDLNRWAYPVDEAARRARVAELLLRAARSERWRLEAGAQAARGVSSSSPK